MPDEIVSIYTLNKESVRRVEAFTKKHKSQLTAELKNSLERLAGYYAKGNRETAEDELKSQKDQINRVLPEQDMRSDFDDCELFLEENRALQQTIPPEDDFVFYLEEEGAIKALLELLRSSRPSFSHQSSPSTQWLSIESAQDQPSDANFNSYLLHRTFEIEAAKHIEEVNKFSYDRELWLWDEKARKAAKGRVLACRCHQGKQWSITFRLTQQWPDAVSNDIFLNKIAVISDLLRKMIFKPEVSEEHGLVVITGRTASCKSQIAHKLIETHLKTTSGRHLPTFEDPIERHFDIPDVQYTPREKGKDVSDLEEAIRNALRQKPAVLFVGEIRDPTEWKLLLDFAGTGHLVVTTAHAGSLIEAMGNILQATEANEPTDRSIVGERLLAVIHLKSDKIICHNDYKVGILIPTLWHRTPEGIKALMAEGLSSLVPNTPGPLPENTEEKIRLPSSIGRYWFARELLKDKNIDEKAREVVKDEEKGKIKTDAFEWDLNGV